uniref:Caeridin-4 n=1 Tax=Ranoidea caerulea TaxID=30344 RepID=CDN4_RANCA|nr:RecName: Full=Caeridin-4 [Ranoidea caerulea]prf//1911335D caeridin 4 [Ranoidea caerulea]
GLLDVVGNVLHSLGL